MKEQMKRSEKKRNISRIGLFVGLMLLFSVFGALPAAAEYALQLPSALTIIDDESFMNDTSITTVSIPDGTTTIGVRAFAGCVNFTRIAIPDSVSSIGEDAFDSCANLTIVCAHNTAAEAHALKNSIRIEYTDSVGVPDGLVYTLHDTHAEITGYTGSAAKLVIPDEIEGKTVKAIADRAFDNCDWTVLTEIVLPSRLESIGDYAFSNLRMLEKIVLPDSIMTLGEYIFDGCQNVAEINFPLNCTSAENAYYNMYVNRVTIPEGVKHIPDTAFYSCYAEEISLPESLESIGEGAFLFWNFVEEITIPGNVKSIGRSAFEMCSAQKVNLPGSLEYIGEQAFEYCNNLTTVTFEEGIKEIKSWAFSNCRQLSEIVLPDSITTLGSQIFSNCEKIAQMNFPQNCTQARNAFTGASIQYVTVPEGVKHIPSGTFAHSWIKELNLPESLESIGESAFNGCEGFEQVSIPSNVNSIESYAFSYCTDLIRINLPKSLEAMGDRVFESCPSLSNVTIEKGAKLIGYYAFSGCSNLKQIEIPDSVEQIYTSAFYNCSSLKNVELPDSLVSMGVCVFRNSGLESITIPSGIETLPGGTFDDCKSLSSVALPQGMIEIGTEAFQGCMQLESINLPSSISEIGSEAFAGCTRLKRVVIPENVTSINFNLFDGCTSLESVELHEGVHTLESDCFKGCVSLSRIYIHPGVRNIHDTSFADISDLTIVCAKNSTAANYAIERDIRVEYNGDIVVPEGLSCTVYPTYVKITDYYGEAIMMFLPGEISNTPVTSIEAEAFKYCYTLVSIELPDTLVSIGREAFANCQALARIYIPDSVTSIDATAFNSVGSGFTIYGESGSYAETYAKGNNISFSTAPFPDHLAEDVWVTLSGRVLLPDGSAAGGVSVSLYKGTGGALAGYGTTDTDGRWSVSKLEPDTSYRIVCHKNGLAFAEMTFTATLEQTVVPDITAMTGDVYLTTDVSAIRAEAAAGSTAVRVTSSGAWTAQTQNEWITLSAQSGVSGDTLTISYSANSDKLRVGFVALTADGLTQRIPVVQIGEASFRLPDPTITTPAENGMELPYASLRVEWTSVPDADHYVISLRDTTTNELLIHHERPEDGTSCVAVLPASFFFMGRSYRIAVGAVPPGMDSSDSTVSWCERTFSVPAQELASDATILGRVCEYEYIDEGENLEMNKHPLANVTVDLYRIGDTSKTHEGTFTTGESGEFTFTGCAIDQVYSLELTSAQQAFASVSGARIAEIFGKSVSKAQEDLLENSAYVIRTEAGENQTGDVTGVPKLGEGHQAWYKKMISGKPHGLWAEYFQFEDGEKNNIFFDGNKYKTYNEYKRWEYGSDEKEIVREINFRWENDTPNKYNALYTTEYDGSGTGLPIRYMFKDNFAAQFNGYLQVPETNTYTFRLTGDDGIRLSLELPYVENGYEKLRQLGGAKWHNIGYAKDFTTSDVMIAADTIMPLNIQYYNKTGVAKLKFEYRTSTDKKWRIVPAEWLYLGRRTCMIDDSWLEPAETMEELDARVEAAFDTMADKTISSFIGDIIGDTIEPVIFAKWDDQKFNSVSEKFVTTAYQGVAKTGFNVVCDFIVDGALDAEDFTAEEAWKKIVDSLPYVKEDADEYGLDTSKLGEDAFASFVRLMQLIYDRDHNFYNELEVSFENFVLFDQCEKSMTGEIGAGIINGFVEACPALDAVKMLRDYLNAIKVERDSNRLRSWIHMSIIENMDQYAGEKNHQIFMGTRVYRVLLDAARASHSAGAALYNTVNVLPGVSGSIYYLDALDQSSNDHLYRYFNSLYDRNPDERLLKQLLIDVIDATSSEYGNMLGGIL